jgi:lipid II:glycine glycyltransferase (peptidoglycan interpeptide bridge formation enzyme)
MWELFKKELDDIQERINENLINLNDIDEKLKEQKKRLRELEESNQNET